MSTGLQSLFLQEVLLLDRYSSLFIEFLCREQSDWERFSATHKYEASIILLFMLIIKSMKLTPHHI